MKFISFKREIEQPMVSEVSRYIFNPTVNEKGYITPILCTKSNFKLMKDSLCELNMVNMQHKIDISVWDAIEWMAKYKNVRSCNFCRYYYAAKVDNIKTCRWSEMHGNQMCPKMSDAETCRFYRTKDANSNIGFDFDRICIKEVTADPIQYKELFNVSSTKIL